jgi:hypothetical protein
MNGQHPHCIDAARSRRHLPELPFITKSLEAANPPQQLMPWISRSDGYVLDSELQQLE